MPKELIRLRLRTWLIAVFSILLCVVGSEITLRYVFGLGDPITVSADQACGYVLSPNQHKIRFGRQVDINEFGMRSGPVSLLKSPDEFRILLVGDSVLYGTSRVGQNQIFAGLLQRELRGVLNKSVTVLNASASAWAIANETDYIRSRGIFSSDLVVLVLNSGDLSQPRATVNDTGEELPTHRYACAWCEVWIRSLKPKLLAQRTHEDAGTTIEVDSLRIQKNLINLDEFRSITTAAHARLAILFVAFRSFVADGAQRSAPEQLVNWSKERRVPLLDLTRFETQIPTGDLTLDGKHLTSRGNRLLASAIEHHWHDLDPPND